MRTHPIVRHISACRPPVGQAFLLVTLLLVALLSAPPLLAYSTSWTHYMEITIQSSQVDTDMTNYTVTLDLSDISSGHSFWTTVKSDGSDIRFTKSDGTTELAVEVEGNNIDTTGKTGWVHFLYTGTLSSSSDTVVRMYYGNSGASYPAEDATYGRENAWNSNHRLVLHMSGASATAVDDTTSNDNDVTADGGDPTYESAGKVNEDIEFDGTGDYLNIADADSLTGMTELTVMCWMTQSSWTSSVKSLLHKDNTSDRSFYLATWETGGNDIIRVLVSDDGSAVDTLNSSTSRSAGTLYHVAFTYDGSDITIYIDGSADGTTSTTNATGAIYNSTTPLEMGGDPSAYLSSLTGNLDEVRILADALTANEMSTHYKNQNSPSTFVSYGTHTANATFIPKVIIID